MITFKDYISEASEPKNKLHDKAHKLSQNIGKYKHRWNDNPSARMTSWVDEYNDLKDEMKNNGTWVEYCKKHGFDKTHDAYDCLA